MMDLRVLLKRLIVANFVSFLAFLVFEALFFAYLPLELQNYQYSLHENESETALVYITGIPVFLIYVASMFYLWKLKKIGRTLFVAVWIISLVIGAGMTPSIVTPVGGVCVTISNLFNGMILGLIYFSELRFHFEGEAPEAT